MARKRTVEAGAINIRVHPHDQGNEYQRLMKAAFELKRPVQVRGDQYMILSHISDKDEDGVIHGALARFTDINLDLPWLDLTSLDKADDSDLKEINIPADLRPNLTSFYIAFDLAKHKMVVETRSGNESLSIRSANRFFDGLLNSHELTEEFGIPSISLESSRESLENIWHMHRIKSLEISIEKPNADTLGLQNKIQARMIAENTQKIEEKRIVIPGKSMTPDDDTKELAEVAVSNGTVKAEGQNKDGSKASFYSKKHPKLERVKYDPDLTTAAQAFRNAAKRFFL